MVVVVMVPGPIKALVMIAADPYFSIYC